ncbi:MAG: UTP--glucose-1-phosphate uridylyltransferase, partial [Proteobacteria bacterium]|nr:UTP--glucose-1-phosphate uridylyltransferase [Pseudomonadota bacterium]
ESTSNSDKDSLKKSRQKLAKILGFDKPNLAYFLALYVKHFQHEGKKKIVLSDKNSVFTKDKYKDCNIAYTTAVASDELMKQLPVADYRELLKSKDDYSHYAKKARLWLKKMQAGVGSSMTRKSYLARIHNISEENIKLGSKGTDLFINYKGKLVSIAEAQILQAIMDAKAGLYSGIILHDIVSNETVEAVNRIWKSPCVLDPKKKYIEYISSIKGHARFKESIQSHQPTIDEKGELSLNRVSPGGHGFIAVDAFLAAYFTEEIPDSDYKNLISVVGNGEDLGSTPDPVMIGWMLKNKISIAMLTTEKTEIDMKGGQIALVNDNGVYVTIVEKAQAESSGQIDLFEQMGLRKGDKKSFFNTNVAVFNYDVLAPKIRKLIEEIGLDRFVGVITPDLIENIKKQIDKDGVARKYTQLEGAMGSSILNLDRFWREHYGEPLVHFINIDRNNRTRFFSPIKTPFDFFMQFFSDRFVFDEKTIRLIDQRPGKLPFINFKDDYYNDVQNVLDAFKGVSILELDELTVEGKVMFNGVKLKGTVIKSSSKEIRK